MNKGIFAVLAFGLFGMATTVCAQESAADSVMNHAKGNRLSVGGYGEVVFSRNLYSDNPFRYNDAASHKNDPNHNRFDLPHAVIYLSYDFGRGWTFGTEIEFEHGGTGSAVELEADEFAEWEQETEKGGEVELEQFWIQKSFARWANIKAGHIVVPVGLTNAHHEPLQFFTVYRPEGENTILPCTWHQTGVSFWGRHKDFRYEVQLLAGLNSDQFTRNNWIKNGTKSPTEYEVANKFGAAARIDNYTIPGLRVGLSGYYGHSIGNSSPNEATGATATYKGAVAVGALDFTYKGYNWIVRGQADYGYLGDAEHLMDMYNRTNKKSPFHHSSSMRAVSSHAYAVGLEAGYDIFSQINAMKQKGERLFLFGRYEQYDPYATQMGAGNYDYTAVKRMAVGVNYYPLKQIAVKAEYSNRFLKSGYNNEPSINLSVAYEGFFL
jgi:hypothetical protein